ncbi:hypothetical protein CXF38_11065 [Corynebacterium bovis]|nr:hypothetical protein CXF38_11065 [Corynebacterium bovis]
MAADDGAADGRVDGATDVVAGEWWWSRYFAGERMPASPPDGLTEKAPRRPRTMSAMTSPVVDGRTRPPKLSQRRSGEVWESRRQMPCARTSSTMSVPSASLSVPLLPSPLPSLPSA